jgi:hypothetical protein
VNGKSDSCHAVLQTGDVAVEKSLGSDFRGWCEESWRNRFVAGSSFSPISSEGLPLVCAGDVCAEMKRAAAASEAVKAVRWTSPTSFATENVKTGSAAATAVSEVYDDGALFFPEIITSCCVA